MSAREGKTSSVCFHWVWFRLLLSLRISMTQKQEFVEKMSQGFSWILPPQQLVWSVRVHYVCASTQLELSLNIS